MLEFPRNRNDKNPHPDVPLPYVSAAIRRTIFKSDCESPKHECMIAALAKVDCHTGLMPKEGLLRELQMNGRL
jgi:hypothetical protein